MDFHKESISIPVMNSAGKVVMEFVIETKAPFCSLSAGGGELSHAIAPFKGNLTQRAGDLASPLC
jgi:hypothetical protein